MCLLEPNGNDRSIVVAMGLPHSSVLSVVAQSLIYVSRFHTFDPSVFNIVISNTISIDP